ncbi:hypothetical protein MXD95_021165 [Frankia sp. AiPa1]|nr:hypothetical protein [Frankia sp. AiPa1]
MLRAVVRELRILAETAAFAETGIRPRPPIPRPQRQPQPQPLVPPDLLDRLPSIRPPSRVERELWRQLSDITAFDAGTT